MPAISILTVHFVPKVAVNSYATWAMFAVEVAVIVVAITIIFNLLFAKKELFDTIKYIKTTFLKRRKK